MMIRLIGLLISVWATHATSRFEKRVSEVIELRGRIVDKFTTVESVLEEVHTSLKNPDFITKIGPGVLKLILKPFSDSKRVLEQAHATLASTRLEKTEDVDFEMLKTDADLESQATRTVAASLVTLEGVLPINQRSLLVVINRLGELALEVGDLHDIVHSLKKLVNHQEKYIRKEIRDMRKMRLADASLVKKLEFLFDRGVEMLSRYEAEKQRLDLVRFEAVQDRIRRSDVDSVLNEVIELGNGLKQQLATSKELSVSEASEAEELLTYLTEALNECESLKKVRDSRKTLAPVASEIESPAESVPKKTRGALKKRRDKERLASLLAIITEEAAGESELSEDKAEQAAEGAGIPDSVAKQKTRRRRLTLNEVLESFRKVEEEEWSLLTKCAETGEDKLTPIECPIGTREVESKPKVIPPPNRRWTYKTRTFYSSARKQPMRIPVISSGVPTRTSGEMGPETNAPSGNDSREYQYQGEANGVENPDVVPPNEYHGVDYHQDGYQQVDEPWLEQPSMTFQGEARPVTELMLRDLHAMTEDVCQRMRYIDVQCCEVMKTGPDPITAAHTERIRRRLLCALLVIDDLNEATANAEYEAFSMPGIPVSFIP